MVCNQPPKTFDEFYRLAGLLLPQLNQPDFKRIYNLYQRTVSIEDNEDPIVFNRLEKQIKRTCIVLPQEKKLCIMLKTADIDRINGNLSIISENFREAFGYLSKIGLKKKDPKNPSEKSFKPMLCFDFSDKPQLTLLIKKTKSICLPNRDGSIELNRIDREMTYRKKYQSAQIPKLFHEFPYIGTIKKQAHVKHMEISELLQRDLFDVIKDKEIPLSLQDKLSIVYQIAGLLHHMHSRGDLHGNVSVENTLISLIEGRIVVKLDGFGQARHLTQVKVALGIGGTIGYWPPELFEHFFYPELYNKFIANPFAMDIWSLGWVIYRLLGEKEPAWLKDADRFQEAYKYQMRYKLEYAYRQYRSNLEAYLKQMKEPPEDDILKYLLWRCWKLKREERITALQIVEFLKPHFEKLHPPAKTNDTPIPSRKHPPKITKD